MKNILSILVTAVALAFGSVANASETGGFDLGIKAGTLGFGAEINYPVSSKLTVAVGLNKNFSSSTGTTDGIDYDEDLNLQTVALLANFHPFSGSFRFTAGVMVNSNELSMTARPSATGYDIGGMNFSEVQVGTLKVPRLMQGLAKMQKENLYYQINPAFLPALIIEEN